MSRLESQRGQPEPVGESEELADFRDAVEIPRYVIGDFVSTLFQDTAEEVAQLRQVVADVDDEETRLLLAAEKVRQQNGLPCTVASPPKPGQLPSLGDLYGQCREQWINYVSSGNRQEVDAVRLHLDEMIREMEAEGTGTMSERLLIQQISLLGVQVHFFQRLQAATSELSKEVSEYKSRKAEKALNLYIKSIESLAKIRTIPIRPRTLVMQQTVLPSPAPTQCIDVASVPARIPGFPAEPSVSTRNLSHECGSVVKLEQAAEPEMSAAGSPVTAAASSSSMGPTASNEMDDVPGLGGEPAISECPMQEPITHEHAAT